MKAVLAVAEIAGLVALVITGIGALVRGVTPDGDSSTGEPPVASTTVLTSPPIASGPPSPSSTAPSGPLCWDARRAGVDCREDHRLEEIPASAVCNQARVITFLGGLSSLDVTIARAATAPTGACAVDATRDVRGSARDVLRGEAAAGWRRCVDRRVRKNVPCSELHSGEYLSTGRPGRATEVECRVAAAQYLDQRPEYVAGDLQIRPLDVRSGTADSARCVIDARGNHLLTGSVRNLGQRPVPIYSG
jgi:hypothetical protein